jgi:WhiB family transcriptional regulator, redox-sensing transcriptional regulator
MKVYPIEQVARRQPPARPGEGNIFPWTPESWMASAACHGSSDPDAWFPEIGEDASHSARTKRALHTCRECPVRIACLRYSLEHGETEGIWGGMTKVQRSRMLSKRRRGTDSEDAA